MSSPDRSWLASLKRAEKQVAGFKESEVRPHELDAVASYYEGEARMIESPAVHTNDAAGLVALATHYREHAHRCRTLSAKIKGNPRL